MSSINTIIFDLDGTLIDSAASILAGFDYVLKINEISPLKPLTPALIGPPLMPTMRMLSGIKEEKKLLEMAVEFKDYYDLKACTLCQPFAGVIEGLNKLIKSKVDLHIATNKRYLPTLNILKYLGWIDLFSSIYTPDNEGVNSYSKSDMIKNQLKDLELSYNQTIYVGDRVEDMEAADSNHLKFIGVSWGYGEFSKNVTIIHSFDQLNELVAP